MLKGLFSPDNPVIRVLLRLGQIWLLNILWLITSIPIVTIGASTTALIYSCMKLSKNEGYLAKNFFHSFRENFKQSTAIWLIYAVVGVLLSMDLYYWTNVAESRASIWWAASIAIVIIYVTSLTYVFAIQSKFYNSVKRTIAFSFILPYKHLKETILMLVTIVALVLANYYFSIIFNFMFLNLGIGLTFYMFNVFYSNVFARYVPKEPEESDGYEEEAIEGSGMKDVEEYSVDDGDVHENTEDQNV